jgi:cyclic beta-1,2-glucan synthetase
VFEHCRRAIEKGTTAGPHGLPLIGTCDWNDGMSSVGDEGTRRERLAGVVPR